MNFKEDGCQIFRRCFTAAEIALAREITGQVCATARPRTPFWDNHVVALSVLSESRNPGVSGDVLTEEPFLITELPAISEVYANLILSEEIWAIAAQVLELDEIVYHYSNITRKPARIGPNMAWHRDFPNGYICPRESRFFFRALIPLESMNEENGCTVVLPGTHRITDEEAVDKNRKRDFDLTSALPLCLKAGDVATIHSKVVHGGRENRSNFDRNLLIIQFGIATDEFLCCEREPYTGLGRAEILSRRF